MTLLFVLLPWLQYQRDYCCSDAYNGVHRPPSLPRLKPDTVISPNVAASTVRLLQGRRSVKLANTGKRLMRVVDGLSTCIQPLLEVGVWSQRCSTRPS